MTQPAMTATPQEGNHIVRCPEGCTEYQASRTNNPYLNCGRCGTRMVYVCPATPQEEARGDVTDLSLVEVIDDGPAHIRHPRWDMKPTGDVSHREASQICNAIVAALRAQPPQPTGDEVRLMHAALADANIGFSGVSWDGFNLIGDYKSIAEAKRLVHLAGRVADLENALRAADSRLPERMWCSSCGTVTRSGKCDCTKFPELADRQRLNNYADELLRMLQEQDARTNRIEKAASDVIARWDTPAWKEAPATAEFINRLRTALSTEARGE